MSRQSKFSLRLKYLIEDVDRHGNIRIYARVPGRPKIRIRGLPGSNDFMEAYQRAIQGIITKHLPAKLAPLAKGSFRWLCNDYCSSGEFKQLDSRTQRIRRNTLDRVCEIHGDKPYRSLEVRHIYKIRDDLSDKIEAANSMLKILRQVFGRAVQTGAMKYNPAREVKYLKSGSTGFHTWTWEEIEQFKAHHAIGTKARLALSLLLYLGQRRSDVVRFGRQHIRDGKFHFTQFKNRARKPIELKIPIAADLREVLELTPNPGLQFLVTEWGKPFTANGFGNKFRKWCDEAGLPHCASHGLRKACASILAELGCTDKQIQAITGHRTAKQVSLYTQHADQSIMAARAVEQMNRGFAERHSVPLLSASAEGETDLIVKSLKGK